MDENAKKERPSKESTATEVTMARRRLIFLVDTCGFIPEVGIMKYPRMFSTLSGRDKKYQELIASLVEAVAHRTLRSVGYSLFQTTSPHALPTVLSNVLCLTGGVVCSAGLLLTIKNNDA